MGGSEANPYHSFSLWVGSEANPYHSFSLWVGSGAKGRYIQYFRNKILNLKGSQGEALPSTLLGTAGPFLKSLHRRCPIYNVLEFLRPKNKKD